MVFDIHSHILPNVDDGAKSVTESLQMLELLQDEGVKKVLMTPHFYPGEDDLPTFFRNRGQALAALNSARKEDSVPEIFVGCELYYTDNMSRFNELSRLKIEGTDYILIELPYGGISDKVLKDIYDFGSNFSLTPVFVHLERFGLFKGYKKAVRFVADGNALAQVNASSFFDKRLKKYAVPLAKKNLISFLGSDLHSPRGNPRVKDALAVLGVRFPKALEKISRSSQGLYDILAYSDPLKNDKVSE